jgi:hypothetical protein
MPSRLQVKRAIFEWGAIWSASLLVALLALWGWSVAGTGWEFWPAWSDYDLSVSSGDVLVGNDLSTWDAIEMWERGSANSKVAGVLVQHSFSAPGIGYRYINVRWHKPIRKIRLSILIPAFIAATATAVLAVAYRRTIKQLHLASTQRRMKGVDFSD